MQDRNFGMFRGQRSTLGNGLSGEPWKKCQPWTEAKLTCNRAIGQWHKSLQVQFSLSLQMKTFSRVAKFYSWSAKPDSSKVLWRGKILNSMPPKCAFTRFLVQVILLPFVTCNGMFSTSSSASQERQAIFSCSRVIWHDFLPSRFSLDQKWKPFHE